MNHRILFAAATALYFATVPALTGTSIYVSNQTSGQVNFYDVTSGALQGTLGTYNSPKGLGVDIFGNLYIAASGEDRIYRNTTTGTQTTFLVQPPGSSPVSIAFDLGGNAYVSSLTTGLVSKYTSGGAFIGSVSVPRARGISFNPFNGNLYVAATPFSDLGSGTDSILQLTTSLILSTLTTANLNLPRSTTVDGNGSVIVSNGAANVGSIQGFSTAGVYLGQVFSGLNGADGIVSTSGYYPVYISQYLSNNVLRCTAANTCASFINQGAGVGTSGLAFAATASIPEPATLSLIGFGLAGLVAFRRRKA